MRSLFAVFAYEISQRRLLFVVASALSVVPWIVPLFRPGAPAADVRIAVATVLALLLGLGLSLLLGASIVGSDLAAGRLGFHFAQPIPSWAIWAGRLGAAAALALACFSIVLLPTALFEKQSWAPSTQLQIGSLLLAGAFIPVLVVIAHTLGVILRARNAWLLIVLAALCLASLLLVAGGQPLIDSNAGETLLAAGLIALLALGGGLLLASYIQVRQGRTDLQRSSRALSIALATTLLGVALAFILYSSWALRPKIVDLRGVHHAEGLGAGWLEVEGPLRWRPGYRPTILINPGTGQVLQKVADQPHYFRGHDTLGARVRQPGDGFAAWIRSTSFRGERQLEIVWSDLRAPEPQLRTTGVSLRSWPGALSLSPGGRRLAIVEPNATGAGDAWLTVYEMPSGLVVVSVPIPAYEFPDRRHILRFADDRRVILVALQRRQEGYSVVRHELDIPARTFDPPVWTTALVASSAADIVLSADGESVVGPSGLYSTRTGERLISLEDEITRHIWRTPLLNGRLAISRGNPLNRSLTVLSADSESRRYDLPHAASIVVVDEFADGSLLVALSEPDRVLYSEREHSLWRFEPAAAKPRLIAAATRLHDVALAGDGTVLLIAHDGSLVEIDVRESRQRVVVSGNLDLRNSINPFRDSRFSRLLHAAWEAAGLD